MKHQLASHVSYRVFLHKLDLLFGTCTIGEIPGNGTKVIAGSVKVKSY